ncbi:MAG: hypothetical protein AAGA20_00485 [Planctomycetota bacterium]
MRASGLLLAAAVAAAGSAALLWQSRTTPAPERQHEIGRARPESPRPPEPQDEVPLAAPAPEADEPTPTVAAPRVTYARDSVMQRFGGYAMLQREGGPPIEAATGRIDFETVIRGQRDLVRADVLRGRFDVEIPAVAFVDVASATLEGNRVRFPSIPPQYDPDESDVVLVGVPFPESVLRVVDGGQRSALGSVTVRRASGPSAPLDDAGEVVVREASAPVVLPWIETAVPVWLSVSAPGYAATNVLVDPTVAGDREVALWPSASLTVRVTGVGRSRLRTLVLFREESDERTPVAAMLEPEHGDARGVSGALVFEIPGVAALPHRILAKGVDGVGRTVDLAETRVELEPGQQRDVALRIDS